MRHIRTSRVRRKQVVGRRCGSDQAGPEHAKNTASMTALGRRNHGRHRERRPRSRPQSQMRVRDYPRGPYFPSSNLSRSLSNGMMNMGRRLTERKAPCPGQLPRPRRAWNIVDHRQPFDGGWSSEAFGDYGFPDLSLSQQSRENPEACRESQAYHHAADGHHDLKCAYHR